MSRHVNSNIREHQARYEQYLQATCSQSTYRGYARDLSGFFERLPRVRNVEDVTRLDVQDYKTLRVREGAAPRSVNRALAAVRAFYNWLIEVRGVELANPASRPRNVRVPSECPKALLVKDQYAVLASSEPGYERAFVLLVMTTGLRAGELLHLRREDIDEEVAVLRLRAETTKGHKERSVPLREDALVALRALPPADPLFSPWVRSYGSLRARWREVCRRAGVSGTPGLHSLRHTYATNMLRAGADLRTVQALLGHSNLATTAMYLRVAESESTRKVLKALPAAPETQEEALSETAPAPAA